MNHPNDGHQAPPAPADMPNQVQIETCDNGHTLRLSQMPHRFALEPACIYVEPWPFLMIAAQLILAMGQAQAAPLDSARRALRPE